MPEEPNNASASPQRVGRYEILGHIATGGMGVVYKARDVNLDRVVALKVLTEKFARDDKAIQRFEREAKASAQLRHENIVTTFDVGQADGRHFLALEYVEGTDLQNYIDRQCRLDPEEARQIIVQASRALIHAHEHRIIHRDIKPSNFLMTMKDGRLLVKLTDFGLAIRSENDDEFRVTRDGTTVGTVDYMSPEQARNSKGVDIRSDIYSLGCTFYHLLAGVAPFARGTLPERLIQHMQAEPPDMRKHNKAIPDSLIAIVRRMLAKKPGDRYQTPTELLEALENHDRLRPSASPGVARSAAKAGRKADPTLVDDTEAQPSEESTPARARSKKESAPAEEKRARIARSRRDSETEELAAPSTRPLSRREAEKDEPAPRRPKKGILRGQWVWVLASAGSLGMLVLVLGIVIAFGRGRPQKVEEEVTPPPPPVFVEPPRVERPPPEMDTSPMKMTVGPLPWPVMDAPPADPLALRKTFAGSASAFPETPPTARTLHVRRLAATDATTFRTLAEALEHADADGWTVIEIQDQGPIYVPALPALSKRSVVLRGAAGVRPLLVWLPTETAVKDRPAAPWLSAAHGKLVLDQLDLVVRWPDDRPLVLFDLHQADWSARSCTFSLVGKSAPLTLVRLGNSDAETRPANPDQIVLHRCYLRGAEATVLHADRAPSSLHIEDSLVVGQNQPLIDLAGEDAHAVHSIGSTLIAGQVLLRSRSMTDRAGPLQVHLLDSILSRDDPAAPVGDMIQLMTGDASRLGVKVGNCVYAGWKKLLACPSGDIAGADLKGWRRRCAHTAGDRTLVESWPGNPLSRLEETDASTFLPPLMPELAYAAWSRTAAVGCTIGRLPPTPSAWVERAFDPLPDAPVLADAPGLPPVIHTAQDGLYHGGVLDLARIPDLGAHLQDLFKKVTPAPRVVLHLVGKGLQPTSPLRLKGVPHLVLYFTPTKDPKDAIRLEIHPSAIAQKQPLLDFAGGHLELIGARVQLGATTFVPSIIKVHGGDLTLTRCWLQGPLSKASSNFESLIQVSNSATAPATVLLRRNVLLSNKLLLHLQDNVQLKARDNLLLSLGDGILFDAPLASNGPLVHLLDHNTCAVRHTTLSVRTRPDHPFAVATTVRAESNAFLNPFPEDTDRPVLLRGADRLAARDKWKWQGGYNVYDARLHAYSGGVDRGNAGTRQSLKDWQQTWGPSEHRPDSLLAGKAITLDGVLPAALLTQLDRLTLPADLRGNPEQAPPGANLIGLGIPRKKT